MNYAFLLRKVGAIALLINTVAYDFHSFSGKRSDKAEIAFNTNYYWKKVPIGIITGMPSMIDPKIKDRPVFTVGPNGSAKIVPISARVKGAVFETQAGPWVLRNGQLPKIKLQGFDSSTNRNAPRVILGVRPNGKTIVYYETVVKLATVGKAMIELGCTDAMSLDGGSSTCLWVGTEFWGKRRSNIPVGAVLELKQKTIKVRMGPF